MNRKYSFLISLIAFFLFFFAVSIINAQDSTSVYKQIDELKSRLDSLEALMKYIDIDSLKNSMTASQPKKSSTDSVIAGDLLSDITTFFSFNEQEQSSRRKRIDELLQELRSRPGVLNFNGNLTSILHLNTGEENFASGSGSFDLFMFVNFGENINLFVDVEAIGGDGPDKRIESFSSLNGDAGSLQNLDGSDILHVLEAWIDVKLLDEWFQVTAGKIDLTNYFDINTAANDETMQFVSGSFINSSAFPVPSNSPGIRALVNFKNVLRFQLGLASTDNSGDDLFGELFKIVGTELDTDFGKGFYGNIHFYAYKDGTVKDATGYGISLAGMVADQFKLFGRWNENNLNYAQLHPVRKAVSIGAEFDFSFFEKNFLLGVAYGINEPFDGSLKNENILEAFLRFQLNDWIYLSPHIQILNNAFGQADNYFLTAFRTQINF